MKMSTFLYFLTSYLFSQLSLFNSYYFSKTFACFLMSCKCSLLCTLAHPYICDNVVSWLFLWYLSLCIILNSYEVNLSVFFFMISIMYCFKRSIPYIFTFKSYISLGYFSLTLCLCLFHGKNKDFFKKIVYLVINLLYTQIFFIPNF